MLFPLKKKLSACINSWIDEIQKDEIPIAVGLIMFPFKGIEKLGEFITLWLIDHFKILLIGSGSIVSLRLIVVFVPAELFSAVISIIKWQHSLFGAIVGSLSLTLVLVCIASYAIAVNLLWTTTSTSLFTIVGQSLVSRKKLWLKSSASLIFAISVDFHRCLFMQFSRRISSASFCLRHDLRFYWPCVWRQSRRESFLWKNQEPRQQNSRTRSLKWIDRSRNDNDWKFPVHTDGPVDENQEPIDRYQTQNATEPSPRTSSAKVKNKGSRAGIGHVLQNTFLCLHSDNFMEPSLDCVLVFHSDHFLRPEGAVQGSRNLHLPRGSVEL